MALIDNCVGYWKLDSNSNDSTANANNGTDTGSPSYANVGKIGNDLTLNGSTQYVTLANGAALNITSGDITISAWVKTSNSSGEQIIVIKDGGAANNMQYRLLLTSGATPEFLVCSNYTGAQNATSTSGIADGNWHHILGMHISSTNTNRIYVDGVYKATANGNGRAGSAQPVAFGMRLADGYAKYNGQMDEVGIWNRALSDGGISVGATATGEVAEIYNAGAGKTYPFGTANTTNFFQFIN